jgi:hypothetical protein
MKKSKFRRPSAPSDRRKLAHPDESIVEQEQEVSAGTKKKERSGQWNGVRRAPCAKQQRALARGQSPKGRQKDGRQRERIESAV